MATKQDVENLLEAYRQAELHVLRLLATTAETALGTRDWYEQQATHLRILIAEAQTLLRAAQPSQRELDSLYATGFRDGVAETATAQAAAASIPAVAAAATETTQALTTAGLVFLRTTDDAYRRITRDAVANQIMSGQGRVQRMQTLLDSYARAGITSYVDRAGRRWGIDTYAEMALRTGLNRAQNEGRISGYLASGTRLVHVSQHLGADAHCIPYQNKILAVSGQAGRQTMTDPATGRETTVDVYATLQSAIAHGLLHINCRHTLTAYVPGTPLPKAVHATEKHYEAEQAQRYNERMIRQWKRHQAVALTPERQRFTDQKVKAWQARQLEHLAQHPWLARQYDREKVWEARAA